MKKAEKHVPQELHGHTPIRYYGNPEKTGDFFGLESMNALVKVTPFNSNDFNTPYTTDISEHHTGETLH